MRVLRFESAHFKSKLAKMVQSETGVTVMHLGRGIQQDGTLDTYSKNRVWHTLYITRQIQKTRSDIEILWTGGHNRQQDRSGDYRSSEAREALEYAVGFYEADDQFRMRIEDKSTSTVENATRSAEMLADTDTIVVVSDRLHYLAWKIHFIFWLVFPGRKVIFVQLPTTPPDTNGLSVVKHLGSTACTVVGMIGVRRGDPKTIQRRQNLLQSLTGH